jgi:hypothetical protein
LEKLSKYKLSVFLFQYLIRSIKATKTAEAFFFCGGSDTVIAK